MITSLIIYLLSHVKLENEVVHGLLTLYCLILGLGYDIAIVNLLWRIC